MTRSSVTITAGPSGGANGRYSLMEWVLHLAGRPADESPPSCTHQVIAVTADAACRFADPVERSQLMHVAPVMSVSPPVAAEAEPGMSIHLGATGALYVGRLVRTASWNVSMNAADAALAYAANPGPAEAYAVAATTADAMLVDIPHDAISPENIQSGEAGLLAAWACTLAGQAAEAAIRGPDGPESEEDGLPPDPGDLAGLAGVYAVYAIAAADLDGGKARAEGLSLDVLLAALCNAYGQADARHA